MTTGDCSCGCRAGVADQTPSRIVNRPGLREVAYRTGRYATFRQGMVAGLTRSDRPALAALRTREPADLSMALIDAWAVTGDVLTFYTERIANEHYLGTATERRSVAGIAGLIGYRLGPGVAAQTALAFTLDTSPGSPTTVPVAAGAQVQTLPGPGQAPQTFETVEDLVALADWNAPVVRQTQARVPRDGDTGVLLDGSATGVNRGDTLLVVASSAAGNDGFTVVRVTSVSPDPVRQRTTVTFEPALSGLGDGPPVRVHVMRQRAALFGYNAASPLMFVEEVRTALSGAGLLDDARTDWKFATLDPAAVDLDALYETVAVGSPVVLRADDLPDALATATGIGEATRTAYGISAKVTRLDLDGEALTDFGGGATRNAVLLLRGEELRLAEVPVLTPVFGSTVDLVVPLSAAPAPRPVLVRGRRPRVRVDAAGDVVLDAGEPLPAGPLDLAVLTIEPDAAEADRWVLRVDTGDGRTGTLTAPAAELLFVPAHGDDPLVGETALVEEVVGASLHLVRPLRNAYDRSPGVGRGVEIWGNVATGTHGESSVDEVLGSGAAARAFQRFTLRRPPLTHVQAPTPSGGASTLRVFVDDVEWREVPTLFGHGPRDRVFTTTTTDDGRTVVQFGDGTSGARPATGHENIRARYRAGAGLAGLAAADQLSLLMTRPLGVRGVRNPLPADGAQDPQVAVDAAANAPRTVLTLDRVVSLRDYGDFAATFGGIGKAAATWTWDGSVRGVVLAVAGVGGAPVTAPLMATMTTAIRQAGDSRVPLVVRPAEVGLFALEADLVLDPASAAEAVLTAARAALLDYFSFARRDFGQIVSLGEVDAVLHSVRGVVGVLVARLHRTGETAAHLMVLPARSLVPGRPPVAAAAEILVIDPDHAELGVAP